jgi:hypothetical protein
MVQRLASNSADEPFDEGMRQRNLGDGLDFCHFQDPQIGLPLVEPIKRIVVRAQILRQPAMPSKGVVEHATECDPVDRAGMDAEANDPARVLIHDDQDPVGPQRGRFAAEQIHTPETVSWGTYVVQFFLPTLMGNFIGGLSLVAALGHAQVVGGKEHGRKE